MAKVLKECAITTPAARAKLEPGLHWRRLDDTTHIGYRKAVRSGVWVVRWRNSESKYKQAKIGTADDALREGTLSFTKAERLARTRVEAARADEQAKAAGPVLTVRSAVNDYIAVRDARDSKRKGRVVRSDAAQRLGRYILGIAGRGEAPPVPVLTDVPLHKLTEDDLKAWRTGLPDTLTHSSLVRTNNDLKAALNLAHREHRQRLPGGFSDVIRFGLRMDADPDQPDDLGRDNQILADGEISDLLAYAREVDEEKGWEGDLYRLMLVLAATGTRFSQACRIKVRDVQRENSRILVPVSRKGKGKGGYSSVPIGADALAELLPIVTGRAGDEILLERWRKGQAPGSIEWIKDKRGSWKSSSEFSREWQAIKVRAGVPHADPYTFRHSSIVRGIRQGLPIRLVAAMHDTSVAMIERHYSRWITDGLDELAAQAVVPLVPTNADDKVVRLTRANA